MDWWSLTHVAWGLVLSAVVGPFLAVVVLSLWEPFEVLLLSPWAARRGLNFGHEALQNSLLDLVFNIIGVLMAVFLFLPYFEELPFWKLALAGV